MKPGWIILAALCMSVGTAAAQDPAPSAGDPAAGEQVFKKCMSCHSVGDGATNRIGPLLNDVFGRTAGTLEGYRYSKAMMQAGTSGVVWQPDTLLQYLPDPKAMVPNTKMTFVGLKDPKDVENVIAYLMQFSPNYVSSAVPPAAAPAGERPAQSAGQ